MAFEATNTIHEEQDRLVKVINDEMIEYTGKPVPFGFTQNLFLVNDRLWHEIKLEDGTLLYTFLRGNGLSGIVVQEKEEMSTWE